nr:MAG TPA: hypothetical protein [Bacteriophage sp.]
MQTTPLPNRAPLCISLPYIKLLRGLHFVHHHSL